MSAPCSCDEAIELRRQLEVARLQLERVRLAYACPPPGEGDAKRNAWNRRCRWIDSRLKELGTP